jgi:glyoxylase-like metal-dependent hydrolase (beta-lactamase superfamily II)
MIDSRRKTASSRCDEIQPMPDKLKLHAFHCGGVRGYRGFYDVTDEAPVEAVYEPSMFFLIQSADQNILFDTGMLEGQLRDDDGSLGVVLARSDLLPAKLAEVGLGVEDLTLAVVSHLHDDHAGGVRYLGDKPIYVQASELAYARDPMVFQRMFYDQEDMARDLNWVEVSGEVDLLGDGRLTLIPTPGHTPGHQAMRVRLDSGVYVLCADASYLDQKMRERKQPGVVWNPERLIESWELLEKLEQDEDAQLLFTHDLDFREAKRLAPGDCYE